MNIERPRHIRKGQQLFNFLEWLRVEKGKTCLQSHRMADPFYISDKEFDELWKEYLATQKDEVK